MDRWWLTEGVIVQVQRTGYIETITIQDGKDCRWAEDEGAVPRGVPFDCIPEWAEEIHFDKNGSFRYYAKCIYYPLKEKAIPFNNCPDEWKSCIFEIDDELRELLKEGE